MLEIASGTGQHAVYFGRALPHLTWQPSELAQNLAGIQAWLDEAQLPNVLAPLALDVNDARGRLQRWTRSSTPTPCISSRGRKSSACSRISPASSRPAGYVCFYGPYNYGGLFTSESNARFDGWLKSRDPQSGVREFRGR